MKIPENRTGLSTFGLTGVSLMVLHITGYLVGWAWPLLYVCLILMGAGIEKGTK